jgi:DeoR/GlpR family transcriptional regulator of sugar metabolism
MPITGSVLGDLIGDHLARRPMTVLTNVMGVATTLAGSARVELVMARGDPQAWRISPPRGVAESAAAAFHVDMAVVSADAVSVSRVSIASADDARVATATVAHARRVVVACLSSASERKSSAMSTGLGV